MVMKMILMKDNLKKHESHVISHQSRVLTESLHTILMISFFLTRNFCQEKLLPEYLEESPSLTSPHTNTEGYRDSNEVSITDGVHEGDSENMNHRLFEKELARYLIACILI